MKNLDLQYVDLVKQVLTNGFLEEGRNGQTTTLWGPQPIVVEDVYKTFPLIRAKNTGFYTSALETLFFMSGKTNYEDMPQKLRETYWQPWAAKAEELGTWGPFYSHQMRSSASSFSTVGFEGLQPYMTDPLHNTLKKIIDVMLSGQSSRKIVMTLWNDADLEATALESCHSTSLVFNVRKVPSTLGIDHNNLGIWALDLHHTQRSLDLMCGTAADLVYSGLLMHYLCHWARTFLASHVHLLPENHLPTRIIPGKLVFAPVNTHIYEDHTPAALDFIKYWASLSKRQVLKDLSPVTIGISPTTMNSLEYISKDGGPNTINLAKQLIAISKSSEELKGKIPKWPFSLID